jgi:hypothetical protein
MVLAEHDTEVWAPVDVIAKGERSITVRHKNGEEQVLSGGMDQHDHFHSGMDKASVLDLSELESRGSAAIFRRLHLNKTAGEFYTWGGARLMTNYGGYTLGNHGAEAVYKVLPFYFTVPLLVYTSELTLKP